MIQINTGFPKPITALHFSPDGRVLTSCGAEIADWTDFGTRINSLSSESTIAGWSPLGQRRFAGRDGKLVESPSSELFTSKPAWQPPVHAQVMCAAYLHEQLLAIGSGHPRDFTPGSLILWDTQTRKPRPREVIEKHGVLTVATHPGSKLLAWGTGHLRVRYQWIDKPDILDIALPKTTNGLAVSPDGHFLAIIQDWKVLLYNLHRQQPAQSLDGHKGRVTSIAYCPDGRSVISGSWDESVRVWDAETGCERHSYRWGLGKITAVASSPDATRMALGTATGQIAIWDVD